MTRHKIIELEYAGKAFGRLLKLPISKAEPINFVSILDISNDLGIHYYDCLYILTARESRSALVSSDQKMLNAAKKVLPTDAAIHIKDFEAG